MSEGKDQIEFEQVQELGMLSWSTDTSLRIFGITRTSWCSQSGNTCYRDFTHHGSDLVAGGGCLTLTWSEADVVAPSFPYVLQRVEAGRSI